MSVFMLCEVLQNYSVAYMRMRVVGVGSGSMYPNPNRTPGPVVRQLQLVRTHLVRQTVPTPTQPPPAPAPTGWGLKPTMTMQHTIPQPHKGTAYSQYCKHQQPNWHPPRGRGGC